MLNNKKNIIKTIISSVIILVPMLFGAIVYQKLTEAIMLNFNIIDTSVGYGYANMTVFVLPLVMLFVHLLLAILSMIIGKKQELSDKIINISLFIIPLITWFVSAVFYATAFGYDFGVFPLLSVLFSVLFIVIGNFLPKARRNSIFGLKIRWTLANDANWSATHRFGSKIMVLAGVLVLFTAFLPPLAAAIVFFVIVFSTVIAPIVYSYLYYKRDIKEGRATEDDYKLAPSKYNYVVIIILLIIFAVLFVVMFTGDITVSYGNTALKIEATFIDSASVEYSDIDSIELRSDVDVGMKFMGFNSARLNLGAFTNDEFGQYSIYSYVGTSLHIVIKSGDKVLVIGGVDDKATTAIYHEILERIPG